MYALNTLKVTFFLHCIFITMQYCLQYLYNNVCLIILCVFWILPFPSSGRAYSIHRKCRVHVVVCSISPLLNFLSAYPCIWSLYIIGLFCIIGILFSKMLILKLLNDSTVLQALYR